MAIELNHTIVKCRDKTTAAGFLTDILGLPAATPYNDLASESMTTLSPPWPVGNQFGPQESILSVQYGESL